MASMNGPFTWRPVVETRRSSGANVRKAAGFNSSRTTNFDFSTTPSSSQHSSFNTVPTSARPCPRTSADSNSVLPLSIGQPRRREFPATMSAAIPTTSSRYNGIPRVRGEVGTVVAKLGPHPRDWDLWDRNVLIAACSTFPASLRPRGVKKRQKEPGGRMIAVYDWA